MEIITRHDIGVLLLDLTMPHISGEELLPAIKRDHPDLLIIIITGMNEVSTAVECMKMGAFDYLVKAIENNKLVASVRRAIEIKELKEENRSLKKRFLSDKLEKPEVFSAIITSNNKMRSLFMYIESIAKTTQSILITGETGAGKELVARAIHTLSGRTGEYVIVNVAGLEDNMFTDTLFGHIKGAFTGALQLRSGLVETAANGTLFLDEIGDLSSTSQVKLLRLLETGEYFTIGSDVTKKSNARIIAATNKNLNDSAAINRFRKDLYYRLSTHEIEVPPLRERIDDLPLLIDHFLEIASMEMGKITPVPPSELYTLLGVYHFPGNIRELRAMIYDAVSKHKSGTLPMESFKKAMIGKSRPISRVQNESSVIFSHSIPTLKEVTKLTINEALKKAKGNQSIAAQILGISRPALNKRLSREASERDEQSGL